MSTRSPLRPWVSIPHRLLATLCRLLLWYMPVSLALHYSTARVLAITSIATALGAVLWYARPGRARSAARRFATLRLRRVGPGAPWVAGLTVTAPVATVSLTLLAIQWGYPLGQLPAPLAPYIHRPGGWWSIGLMTVLVAPVVEELTFRGWLQRPLERELGAAWAIAITATLFAIAHGEPRRLPLLLLDGIALGVVVHRTRSIWAGVALHGGYNALASVTIVPPVSAALAAFGSPTATELLAVLCTTTALAILLFRGLWQATRRVNPSRTHGERSGRPEPGNVPV